MSKHQYRELDIPDNPDAEPPCNHTKAAIIVLGKHAGHTLTVCVEPDCPVHNPGEAARIAVSEDDRDWGKTHHFFHGKARIHIQKNWLTTGRFPPLVSDEGAWFHGGFSRLMYTY